MLHDEFSPYIPQTTNLKFYPYTVRFEGKIVERCTSRESAEAYAATFLESGQQATVAFEPVEGFRGEIHG